MKLELADIATNESQKLSGFKVLGVIPFHLKYITTRTHIRLCKIRAQIQELKKDSEPMVDDFNNPELQEKIMPLMYEYCVVGLLNDRAFKTLLRPFLMAKIKRCSHKQIWNLYFTIAKLNEPAFFLSWWKMMMMKDNTLLKEATP